jgi:phage gp46-like protein
MDFRTVKTDNGFDWKITIPGLAEEDGLETAVIISLFTDGQAKTDDILPSGDDRRGWWGDTISETEGDRIGSRLWLLSREKQLPGILAKAKEYAEEALRWLVEDGVAKSVTATAENFQEGALGLLVEITKPDGVATKYQFKRFWKGE